MQLNRILRSSASLYNKPMQGGVLEKCLNSGIPSCSQCKFYNPDKTCRKFNEIDIISGDLVHSLAKICRNDETKCGHDAKFYREKTEEDIQDEEDKNFWNDIKYPLLVYGFAIFAINSNKK